MEKPRRGEPLLWRQVETPEPFLTTERVGNEDLTYGGEIRMGDLNGDGQAEFLVYRSVDNAHDGGGMKPCFLGAFSMDGNVLWQVGAEGTQPCRPGPVAVYDLDGDGSAEVICFFHDPTVEAAPTSMANVVVQVRDGKTGEVKREARPEVLTSCEGQGPNWCHQRLLVANLRGTNRPSDFVVKLGRRIIALSADLDVLWTYESEWAEYGKCPAYIPAVGDIDGDGKDEVIGGYYLLDDDGQPLWEKQLAPHMDSVTITAWDDGHARAICSGGGHVMDAQGNAVTDLGEDVVPHGQEVRVARFLPEDDTPQMLIRYNAHTEQVLLANTAGEVVNRFSLNPTPNNTGMEVVYWDGPDAPARVCNGDGLWTPAVAASATLPGLPTPCGPHRSGWYHCIAADVCGDTREEVVLYNPWDRRIFIYTPAPLDADAYAGYHPGPRQYNPRLMD